MNLFFMFFTCIVTTSRVVRLHVFDKKLILFLMRLFMIRIDSESVKITSSNENLFINSIYMMNLFFMFFTCIVTTSRVVRLHVFDKNLYCF